VLIIGKANIPGFRYLSFNSYLEANTFPTRIPVDPEIHAEPCMQCLQTVLAPSPRWLHVLDIPAGHKPDFSEIRTKDARVTKGIDTLVA
jgi:hypothetical protein